MSPQKNQPVQKNPNKAVRKGHSKAGRNTRKAPTEEQVSVALQGQSKAYTVTYLTTRKRTTGKATRQMLGKATNK
jgi:hypothetical protein